MSIDPQKSQVYNDYYLKKKGWSTDGHTRLQGVVIVAPDKNGDDIKVFEAYAHFCKAEEVHAMAYLLTGATPRDVSYNGLIIGGTVKDGKLVKGPAPNFTSTAMVPVGISVDGRCVPFYASTAMELACMSARSKGACQVHLGGGRREAACGDEGEQEHVPT